MNNELRHPLTDLTAGSLLRLRDGEGRAVVVFEGQVWITLEDDTRDIVLSAGESFSIDRPGLTLVQACRDSKLMLVDAEPGTGALAVAPQSYELHRRARMQRDAAIGDAFVNGLTALHGAVARLLADALVPAPSRRLAPSAAAR